MFNAVGERGPLTSIVCLGVPKGVGLEIGRNLQHLKSLNRNNKLPDAVQVPFFRRFALRRERRNA